ncbi:M24 family metallopeptidase [bacterium]|nr:M24 family metallopeptidase [bacterium]
MNLHHIQAALRQAGIDGWLFCDFHNRDPIAYLILGLDSRKFTSRRWFYYIPADGSPHRLAHRVEPVKLDSLPGELEHYLGWRELHQALKKILGDPKTIAMQYSPMNHIPYVSLTDAGTVELIRSFGHRVVSSADLVQIFEAVIDEAGYRSHKEASRLLYQIKDEAFAEIEKSLNQNLNRTEYDIQQFIVNRFHDVGMSCCGENPIVGVNGHPANPHFEPTPDNSVVIKKNDTILIDLWARLNQENTIWADITWCGYAGNVPPKHYIEIFEIVRDARDAGIRHIKESLAAGETCHGWQVDDAVRNVIREAGYGDFFIHRTGHSIGREVHGNGVNIDNLETREERMLIPGSCFSIEPGIYLEGEMAVRTEVDVFITQDGRVEVTGEAQESLILMEV